MRYIDYMQLNPFQKFGYNFTKFFKALPGNIAKFFKFVGMSIVKFFVGIGKGFANYGKRFVKGDASVKLSYLIFGFGNMMKGQIIKGLIFLLTEAAYICFMLLFGWQYLSKLDTLGTVEQHQGFDPNTGMPITVKGENSMLILLYSVLAIVVTIVVFAIYIAQTKSAYKCYEMKKDGKQPLGFVNEMKQFMDEKFHVTLMTLPCVLIGCFTILPMVFMILIAFTNYDSLHQPPGHLFTWNGLENFSDLVNIANGAKKATTFVGLAEWTVVWAVFATFTNYIFGVIIALMINKKGIKLKSLWRTLFVVVIAVPQFVSLLVMNQMLGDDGAFNVVFKMITGSTTPFHFLGTVNNPLAAQVTVIIVNLWVGIPYTILITSGILMNIPVDLYESATIDGAGPVKSFMKITLPYMLFVTTPYLITSFIGNINNFNVIYLLSNGNPSMDSYYHAGGTDILVTWLFKLTMEQQDYGLASAIGILVFIVCATLSLITFNLTKSAKDEEAFS